MKTLILGCLALLLFSLNSWAYTPISGAIPKDKGPVLLSAPATDLWNEREQRLYIPFELDEILRTTNGIHDLSEIEPDPTTDIYSPAEVIDRLKDINKAEEAAIPVKVYMDEVEYVDSILNEDGFHRFSVIKRDAEGMPFNYNVFVGRKAHNIILRRNLLRKIGYKVPATKYIEKVKLTFKDKNEKEDFLRAWKRNTPLSTPTNWIATESDNMLVIQDLVMTQSIEPIYNFSLGYISGEIVRGRRLINALLIPFNLVDIPESVNQFTWSAGRIVSDNIYLPHQYNSEFSTTWHDARWIARKILNLKEDELAEIVEESNLPPTVQVIVKEKLKARRNSLSRLFEIDAIEYPIRKMEDLDNGDCLLDGKLICSEYEGYGSRFAYEDPESPLANSELSSFLGMQGISTALDSTMGLINRYLGKFFARGINKAIGKDGFFVEDLNQTNSDIIDQHIQDTLDNSIGSGQPVELPLKTWVAPIASGNLIFSRNVIAGAFLGTDNILQMVDTVGFQVAGGAYMGMIGLPGYLNDKAIAGFSAQASYQRTYAHITPILSPQKALKETVTKKVFKNIIASLVKRKYGKYFDDLAADDFNDISEEERAERIDKALTLFRDNLEVGESILITDTIGVAAAAQANIQIKLVNLKPGISPSEVVVSRLHILRKGENEIQIYRDFGNMNGFEMSLGISAGIPIIKSRIKFANGRAKTKYVSVNTSAEQANIVETLRALRNVLLKNSMKQIEKIKKPWILKHKYKETNAKLGIFTLRVNKIKNQTAFSLTSPEGDTRNFFRKYDGSTIGNDYQTYASELIAGLTGNLLGVEIAPSGLGGGNPGNSFFGTAKNTISTFEAEIQPGGLLKSPFVKVTQLWNGWRMKRKKVKKLIDKIRKRYRFRFFDPNIMNDTSKLFLYNINLNFNFYEEGLAHMATLTDKEVETIFDKYNSTYDPGSNQSKKIFIGSGKKRFKKWMKKFRDFMQTADYKKISKYAVKMMKLAQRKLSLTGLTKLMGGKQNMYVYLHVDGFRDGNEDARNIYGILENPYISNSYGEFGREGFETLAGPLSRVIKHTGMSSAEFYLQWLLGRVY